MALLLLYQKGQPTLINVPPAFLILYIIKSAVMSMSRSKFLVVFVLFGDYTQFKNIDTQIYKKIEPQKILDCLTEFRQ